MHLPGKQIRQGVGTDMKRNGIDHRVRLG
jgi:hypothetical protein